MDKPTEWIKQHQVAVFLLLAFVITWGALIPAMAMRSETRAVFQVLVFYLARIGVYGPVLAGIIVTRVAAPEQDEGSRSACRVALAEASSQSCGSCRAKSAGSFWPEVGSVRVICPLRYLTTAEPCSRPVRSTSRARTDSVPKSRPRAIGNCLAMVDVVLFRATGS